jgi:DNA-binding MarR family transcriptional regulator
MKHSDYQALAEFRYQIRSFLTLSEQAARRAGLEPQQHQLLLALKGLPKNLPATIGHLAERLQLQHHSAVELIDRLEARRLVRRRRSGKDRRVVEIGITPQGERVLSELSLHHKNILRKAGPVLVRSLKRVVASSRDDRGRRRRGSSPGRAHWPPRGGGAH